MRVWYVSMCILPVWMVVGEVMIFCLASLRLAGRLIIILYLFKVLYETLKLVKNSGLTETGNGEEMKKDELWYNIRKESKILGMNEGQFFDLVY